MNNVIRDFLDNQTDDEKEKIQKALDHASSEQAIIKKLEVSGTYLMEVATFAFNDKTTKEMRCSPEIIFSPKSKALILLINLRVVDGTSTVPAGSSIFSNIVISPASGASQEKIDNTMSMMKPKIAALTGISDIKFEATWLEENLQPVFKKTGKKFELVKDHKMKQRVMVTVEDDIYLEREVLKVTSIVKAKEGDKSISNTVKPESTSNVEAPPKEEDQIDSDVNSENIISGMDEEGVIVPEIADTEDFNE